MVTVPISLTYQIHPATATIAPLLRVYPSQLHPSLSTLPFLPPLFYTLPRFTTMYTSSPLSLISFHLPIIAIITPFHRANYPINQPLPYITSSYPTLYSTHNNLYSYRPIPGETCTLIRHIYWCQSSLLTLTMLLFMTTILFLLLILVALINWNIYAGE